MTQNQTQAGQTAQSAFAHQCRETANRTTPTISASAAWRLGIAAYGLAASWTSPSVVDSVDEADAGNIRGGAVGMSDVAEQADHVREQDRVAEAAKRSWRRR